MKSDFNDFFLGMPVEHAEDTNLAIDGGNPVITKLGRRTTFPNITKEDVFQLMTSIQGEPEAVVNEFCEKYRKYVGANYAIATASGTCSLQLALIGAGVKPGDEVIIPAFTFIATAQAVVAAKAIPVFADIDPDTFDLDPAAVEAKITDKTAAIMPVHVHGLPAAMDELSDICQRHHLLLLEDASHAHSATYHGKMCGSIGDAAGQSLMADKNFPAGGEGGIAFFKTEESYQRALKFLDDSGLDFRMSWLAAAFGISQLDRLPYYDQIRQRNAHHLIAFLNNETRLFNGPYIPDGEKHSFNMFRIKLNVDLPEFKGIEDYKIKQVVQNAVLEEGVFAREWQNVPIPWHLPFKNKIGFGHSYPFSLDEGTPDYSNTKYPNVLDMLNTTLVLCRELRSPVEYEKLSHYEVAFKKLDNHIGEIAEMAKALNVKKPYERDARLG
ncbi:DegT/DnrJ/EryC1/StrS family aminotransferase [Lactiplantibacillus plantarum]|uniref:Pyridoxal-phosphate-dependent aminotransferase n=1 Tax=Lactiplantibacillus plantarum (strain ATCC BAA-793 / NCIMB 8826 / WCFS1) TaxID=220668 RepID=F9UKW8_LACPL|nr:DegT/DnrJ/EryC1/StrS family aminotransferase [Lactiplantibacillus plantarum]MDE4414907.1 DegT/DnrJ/EryC1/StrS family aminotransferase [Lactiplantibacillus plantarum]MDE4417333.1 DegT/DnrJ/EryC1/StrS family aminotransferase [Lactiplantibacillus plantarum]MDE4420790.1 DegT/DnrJ/EryC1/StrS family aminotransferase [Lactiplantibacillus plantarum]MDE4423732.1 DegT/DnrJ/EryC1/StrS family aminotransferase [Lactiplantibacillus plantarum]MDE4426624.1 DegT/DnrJ/EryC1/StrS family aminotransferase [Lact